MINNLTQLKKAIKNKPCFKVVAHCRPEQIGKILKVNVSQTNGFFCINPNNPEDKTTIANGGKGSWLGFSSAPFWKFENGICSIYNSDKLDDGSLILSMEVIE